MRFTTNKRSIGCSCGLIAIHKDIAITIISGKGYMIKSESQWAGQVCYENHEFEQAEEFISARNEAVCKD